MSQAVGSKHPVDQMLPAGRPAVLGLQHVLVMYAGCVAVPLIVGGALKLDASTIAILVNADLFVAGVITIIQSLGRRSWTWSTSPVSARRAGSARPGRSTSARPSSRRRRSSRCARSC